MSLVADIRRGGLRKSKTRSARKVPSFIPSLRDKKTVRLTSSMLHIDSIQSSKSRIAQLDSHLIMSFDLVLGSEEQIEIHTLPDCQLHGRLTSFCLRLTFRQVIIKALKF